MNSSFELIILSSNFVDDFTCLKLDFLDEIQHQSASWANFRIVGIVLGCASESFRILAATLSADFRCASAGSAARIEESFDWLVDQVRYLENC